MFSLEDLTTKGKAGYNAVVNTLVSVATQVRQVESADRNIQAKDKFDKDGLDYDTLVAAAQNAQHSIIQLILNFFRRARPQSSPKIKAEEADENQKVAKTTKINMKNVQAAVAATAATTEPAAADVEEEIKKVDAAAAPVVAAN